MNHTVSDDAAIAEFGARLKLIAREFRSGNALADAIGRSSAGFRKWVNGEAEPNVSDLRKICAVTGTRLEWLVYGSGPRSASEKSASTHPIYEELFLAVFIAVEEQAEKLGIALGPIQKGQLVLSIYDLAGTPDRVDPGTIAGLLRAY